MPITRGRWGSKLVLSLLFKNAKNEKQCSSSTLPGTWTTAISTNLIYLGKSELELEMHQLFSKFVSMDWEQKVVPWQPWNYSSAQLEHSLFRIKLMTIQQCWNHLVGLTKAHHFQFTIPGLDNVQVLGKTLLTIGLQPILRIQNAHGIK